MAHTVYDVTAGIFFTLASASAVGRANVELPGFTFTDTLTVLPLFGELELGFFLSVALLAGAWALNKPNIRAFNPEKQFLIGATLALLFGAALWPALSDLIASTWLSAYAVMAIHGGGFWVIATGDE